MQLENRRFAAVIPRMTEPASALDGSNGRHFDRGITLIWEQLVPRFQALGFKLSARDLVQMMAPRGHPAGPYEDFEEVQPYVPDFTTSEPVRLIGRKFVAGGCTSVSCHHQRGQTVEIPCQASAGTRLPPRQPFSRSNRLWPFNVPRKACITSAPLKAG